MDTTKQPVQGGQLLDALAKMFFGGIDRVLSKAAEYEEEMGVLKQITRITLHPDDDPNKDYLLTIKLSPVRDKNSMYYVEAETNAPGFDVSSINEKVMKIDKTKMDAFNKMIDKLIADNQLVPDVEEVEAEEGEESTDQEPQEGELTAESKMLDLVEQAKSDLARNGILAQGDGVLVSINVEFDNDLSDSTCSIEITGTDAMDKGKEIKSLRPEHRDISLVGNKGEVIDYTTFYKSIQQAVDDFVTNNSLTNKQFVSGSTKIQASFILEKDTKDVSLTAIKASCNIKSAMDVVYDVLEDEDFLNQLVEDEAKAFEITDEGGEYDVEPIDEIDTSETYCDIFKLASIAYATYQTYRWALGRRSFDSSSILCASEYPLSRLVENAAIWVVSHTNKYPTPIGTFGNDCTDLNNVKENGEISKDLIEEDMKAVLEGLTDDLDVYYVNLEHDEQSRIDDFISEVRELLAYA